MLVDAYQRRNHIAILLIGKGLLYKQRGLNGVVENEAKYQAKQQKTGNHGICIYAETAEALVPSISTKLPVALWPSILFFEREKELGNLQCP